MSLAQGWSHRGGKRHPDPTASCHPSLGTAARAQNPPREVSIPGGRAPSCSVCYKKALPCGSRTAGSTYREHAVPCCVLLCSAVLCCAVLCPAVSRTASSIHCSPPPSLSPVRCFDVGGGRNELRAEGFLSERLFLHCFHCRGRRGQRGHREGGEGHGNGGSDFRQAWMCHGAAVISSGVLGAQSCAAVTLRPSSPRPRGGDQSGRPAYPHPNGAGGRRAELRAAKVPAAPRRPRGAAISPQSRRIPTAVRHPAQPPWPRTAVPLPGPFAAAAAPHSPRPHPHASSDRRADGFHGDRHDDDALSALPPPPHGAVSPRCSGGRGHPTAAPVRGHACAHGLRGCS